MTSDRKLKKIDLETLDKADRKVSSAKLRKVAVLLAILVFLGGGGYAAYVMVSGDVMASRLTVNKMSCPACIVTVKEVTEKIPGVVDANVSLAAQDVIVKFRNKKTDPDVIKAAIVNAGYPTQVDGVFTPTGEGANGEMAALVNGKPVFIKDLKTPMGIFGDKDEGASSDPAAAFFSVVGKAILLQAADSAGVVVQPQEVELAARKVAEAKGVDPDKMLAEMSDRFGSKEKYLQAVGQRLGILALRNDHVLEGVTDPGERQRKTMEWVGALFKDADVKILDPDLKAKIHAAAGQDDWKTFWPRMLGKETQLKALLAQQ